jgi:hypothetical protein
VPGAHVLRRRLTGPAGCGGRGPIADRSGLVVEVAELAEVGVVVVRGVARGGHRADAGDLAGGLVGVAAEEDLGLDGGVEDVLSDPEVRRAYLGDVT